MATKIVSPWLRSWVYLLPFLHLCVCLAIALMRLDAAWGYLFFVDMPMSVIILAISYNSDHPLVLFGTLGTLWWYLVSRAVWMIGSRVLPTIWYRRDPSAEKP